jgi:XTP/dITP diphosphohydrolase
MILILATNNLHKRNELLAMLRYEIGQYIEIKTLEEAGLGIIEIEEPGATLEENALIKARTIHKLTNLPTLADDTGLEVDALGGAPGVYSARYAGEKVSYNDNVTKLLSEMSSHHDRRARFRTVIAFIDQDGVEQLFSGEVEGVITCERRGSNGFGYDPVFEPNEAGGQTFAEMAPDEKNRISHRALALVAAARSLKANA